MRSLAKSIAQFRYYGENNPKNSKNNADIFLSKDELVHNNVFEGYDQITQLGIQSLPGTKFYLNASQYPILIGNTGIYELNVEGIVDLTSIKFDSESIAAINNNPTAHLIIDIIYEIGG